MSRLHPTVGDLDRRVTVQRVAETRNPDGGVVQTWATLATRWAMVEPMTGREMQTAGQTLAEATHAVVIYNDAGIGPHDRIVYSTKTFDILHVRNVDERPLFVELLCKEVI
jgi:SPP1 family predicted phage head-tail adaptor